MKSVILNRELDILLIPVSIYKFTYWNQLPKSNHLLRLCNINS